jgi:hypothetical protein
VASIAKISRPRSPAFAATGFMAFTFDKKSVTARSSLLAAGVRAEPGVGVGTLAFDMASPQ